MGRRHLALCGLAVLGASWLGPLPELASRAFSAHMTLHMLVVALAAPLLALGIAGSALDPAVRWPVWFAPVPASVVDLVVIWSWHAPALHHAARTSATALLIEQTMFLAAGLLLWLSVVGGPAPLRAPRAAAGVVALLLTSMHMTLLGALLALAPRPLYAHARSDLLTPLDDQHLGGAIMLGAGGAVYLTAGLGLVASLLRRRVSHRARRA